MAHTIPEIRTITDLKGPISDRTVYFLKLNPRMQPAIPWDLVAKGEMSSSIAQEMQEDQVSISWGAKMMKNVASSEVNTKNMTPVETAIFKAAARLKVAGNARALNGLDATNVTWTKLPYIQGLEGSDSWGEESGTYHSNDIKKIILKFLDEASWLALGKIVAVDIFTGNNDRIGVFVGQQGEIVNAGNLIFATNDGATKMVGLDTYNATNRNTSNMNTTPPPAQLAYLNPLKDEGARRMFAAATTKKLGELQESNATKAGMKVFTITVVRGGTRVSFRLEANQLPTIFVPYTDVFINGLRLGTEELKRYLQEKVRHYGGIAVPPARPNVPPPVRPMIGGQRGLPPGFVPPNKPLPPIPGKQIPEGILGRMRYLGWL